MARFIYPADVARSTAFYRDVLGFRIEGEAAIYGPARIQFAWGVHHSGILFFETDDVEGMRAAIAARGGAPSGIEKVNWIKMRMFEVRDPDGNTLWFGQSYDGPDAVSHDFVVVDEHDTQRRPVRCHGRHALTESDDVSTGEVQPASDGSCSSSVATRSRKSFIVDSATLCSNARSSARPIPPSGGR